MWGAKKLHNPLFGRHFLHIRKFSAQEMRPFSRARKKRFPVARFNETDGEKQFVCSWENVPKLIMRVYFASRLKSNVHFHRATLFQLIGEFCIVVDFVSYRTQPLN